VATALRSTKDCCEPLTTSRNDISQISQCGLLVEENFTPRVVVIGEVFEGDTTLHNVAISIDVMKVTVDKVRVVEAPVPLPTDEVTTMVKACQTFIA